MKFISTITAALLIGCLTSTMSVAAKIGTTGSAKNIVTGNQGGKSRSLSAGSPLFSNELVSTGAKSAAQLLFKDKATMTLGSNAAVQLDQSIYNPAGGSNTLNAVKGAFRFISGISKPGTYKIRTPVASIGIRGSIIEGYIDQVTGWEVFVLVQGSMEVCTTLGCKSVTTPGSYIRVKPNGGLVGPAVWRGPYFNLTASVNFVRNELHILLEPDQDSRAPDLPPPTGNTDEEEEDVESGGNDF